jgi:homoserine kinase type II
MSADSELLPVLACYPPGCRPRQVVSLGSAGGFSGACFWRLETDLGALCLRRWPPEHPTIERLQFIQAVLWHVRQEGFLQAPLPLETLRHAGYVQHAGHLWELSPWMPGQADYHLQPSAGRLRSALGTLARFHQAASSFPLPETAATASPGIAQRLAQVRELLSGGFQRLAGSITSGVWPALDARAGRLLELAGRTAPGVQATLADAAARSVGLQPCIRDIWHDHILYVGQRVSAIIDFGALRAENVSADIARLLGSLAGDDAQAWQVGLQAYQAVRPLSGDEHQLLVAFDRSTVLLSGLNWLRWVYQEHRQFDRPDVVLARIDANLTRLACLAGD